MHGTLKPIIVQAAVERLVPDEYSQHRLALISTWYQTTIGVL